MTVILSYTLLAEQQTATARAGSVTIHQETGRSIVPSKENKDNDTGNNNSQEIIFVFNTYELTPEEDEIKKMKKRKS